MTRKEYEETNRVLKRFIKNFILIKRIVGDIASIGSPPLSEIKSFYISDSVLNKVIQLDENERLKKAKQEYQVVLRALEIISKDAQQIFLMLYIFNETSFNTQNKLGISLRTFARRKKELVQATYNELKNF